jgi:hypothetical protein
MSDKLFSVAGYATNPDGTVKVRFANDLVARIKILNKAGCTDINLTELPRPMTKVEALEFLSAQGITGDAGFVIGSKLDERKGAAQRAGKKVTLATGTAVSTATKPARSKAKTKAERAVELGLADSLEAAQAIVGDEAL